MASNRVINRPELMKRSVRTGLTLQKKHIRRIMGWLRPIRCPVCKQYTKQRPYGAGETVELYGMTYTRFPERQCQSCDYIFTRAESRSVMKEDRYGKREI